MSYSFKSNMVNMMMDECRENNVPSSRPHSTSSTHSPSHHSSTPTSRRNRHISWPRHGRTISTSSLLLIIFACFFSIAPASQYISESMVEVQTPTEAELLRSELDRLTRTGSILVDPNPPQDPKTWVLATEHDDLLRRSFDLNLAHNNDIQRRASHTSESTTMITSSRPTATKGASTGTSSSGVAVETDEPVTPLPAPFDQGFAGNITDSCSTFMYGFLTNATFQACLPFSLLLQGSTSFFTASKSITKITQTLDATCAANLSTCTPLMTALASNLTASQNCASDLTNQNPLITSAHLGLLAYKPLYTASCLRNPSTGSYCFADAVTNASSPTDSYVYYLPLNISLPGGSQPTCNSCLKDTMAVFESESADRKGVLAGNYVSAATQVNLQCGPSFVNQSLAPEIKSGAVASPTGVSSNLGVLALVMLVGSWLL